MCVIYLLWLHNLLIMQSTLCMSRMVRVVILPGKVLEGFPGTLSTPSTPCLTQTKVTLVWVKSEATAIKQNKAQSNLVKMWAGTEGSYLITKGRDKSLVAWLPFENRHRECVCVWLCVCVSLNPASLFCIWILFYSRSKLLLQIHLNVLKRSLLLG